MEVEAKDEQRNLSSFGLLRGTFSLLTPRKRVVMAAYVIAFVALGLLDVAVVALTGVLLGAFPDVGSSSDNSSAQVLTQLSPITAVGIFVFLVLLRSAGFVVCSYFLYRSIARISVQASTDLAGAVMKTPWQSIQQYSSQRLAYLCGPACENLGSNVLAPSIIGLADAATAMLVLLLLSTLDPAATGSLALFYVLVVFLVYLAMRHWVHRLGRESQEMVVANYSFMNSLIRGWFEVKARNRENNAILEFVQLRKRAARVQISTQLSSVIPRGVLEGSLVVGLALTISVVYLQDGPDRVVAATAIFLVAAYRLLPIVMRMQGTAVSLRRASGQLSDFFASFEYFVNEASSPRKQTSNPMRRNSTMIAQDCPVPTISVKSFSMNRDEGHDLLSYPDMTVTSGSVAVVAGPSGRGKSTLLRVIAGLHTRKDHHSVRLNGLPVDQFRERYPGAISLVPQAPALFPDSVRSNLRFFSSEYIDELDLWKALETVQLADRFSASTRGLDAILLEGSSNLSGGEMHRLSLARHLMDPPRLLLLDEPFSALDDDTSAAILVALESLRGKCTVVVVSHKLPSDDFYDQLIYLR